MIDVTFKVWLYGEFVCYSRQANPGIYSIIDIKLPAGSTLKDLLDYLQLPAKKRGITFINGLVSAVPEITPDFDYTLQNNDRITFVPVQETWQVHRNFALPMTTQLSAALLAYFDQGQSQARA